MVLPSWFKPPAWIERLGSQDLERQSLAPQQHRPIFLREVSDWDLRWQRMLFQILIPPSLLTTYSIDPITLTDPQGRPAAFLRPGAGTGSFRLELFHSGDAVEPMGELELADTAFNQIEIVWVALQDPFGLRYDIDVMPDGASTMRGTACRNLVAEQAAMVAGLAPGQVRRGLRAFRWLTERVETLMLCLNQREYVAQPLFYHTAVLFEQHGFSYIQGQARMEAIAEAFAPGGRLRARLDSSLPFRQPRQADSVRGRSWAIHDGILDEPWDRVRLVKRLGVQAGVNTCPGLAW